MPERCLGAWSNMHAVCSRARAGQWCAWCQHIMYENHIRGLSDNHASTARYFNGSSSHPREGGGTAHSENLARVVHHRTAVHGRGAPCSSLCGCSISTKVVKPEHLCAWPSMENCSRRLLRFHLCMSKSNDSSQKEVAGKKSNDGQSEIWQQQSTGRLLGGTVTMRQYGRNLSLIHISEPTRPY